MFRLIANKPAQTYISVHYAMNDEEEQSLDGVKEAEQPFHYRCGNIVTNDKEAQGPSNPKNGKKDK